MAWGLAVGDFDGDRDLDLVIPGPHGTPIRAFRNDGPMQFVEVTASAGLGSSGFARAVGVVDLDGDHDQDLILTQWAQPTRLYINSGGFQFTEEAAARGLVAQGEIHGVSCTDYDRDGHTDVLLPHRVAAGFVAESNQLFRNLGGGTFADVTASAGVQDSRATFTALFVDLLGDGIPDIFCANDLGTLFGGNEAYLNIGNGNFSCASSNLGLATVMEGMGVDYADIMNDGRIGIMVTDTAPTHALFQFDPTLIVFQDVAPALGVVGDGISTGWAANFLDHDNDQWPDLHVVHFQGADHLYRNPGASGGPWLNVAPSLALDIALPAYCAVAADLDDDGGIDLLVRPAYAGSYPSSAEGLVVLQNQVPRGHWLTLDLTGTAPDTCAFGTRVELAAGGTTQQNWKKSGTGFLGSTDPRVHLGLGTNTMASQVLIEWASGSHELLFSVPADQTLIIQEPELRISGPLTPGSGNAILLDAPQHGGHAYVVALSAILGPGPQLSPHHRLPTMVDALTQLSLTPGNSVLASPIGTLDGAGSAQTALHIPPLPQLSGITVYAVAAIVDPSGQLNWVSHKPLKISVN